MPPGFDHRVIEVKVHIGPRTLLILETGQSEIIAGGSITTCRHYECVACGQKGWFDNRHWPANHQMSQMHKHHYDSRVKITLNPLPVKIKVCGQEVLSPW